MSVKERLKKMKKSYEESQNTYNQMFGGSMIPEGTYIAKLSSAKFKEAKSSGKLMIQRNHVILEGEYSGMVAFDNMQVETEWGFVFIRRWIEIMGYECPDAEEMETFIDLLNAITEESPVVKIEVKHSGTFVNVDVIERLETEESKESEEPEESEKEDSGTEELYSFCQSNGIEVDSEASEDELIEAISEFEFEEKILTSEELKLLKDSGLQDCIKKPVTKRKKTTKKKK